MPLDKIIRNQLDAHRRAGQTEFELGPGAIACVLTSHADSLRAVARSLDGDFDPHGFEGAQTQGRLRQIAHELQDLAGDVRKIQPKE